MARKPSDDIPNKPIQLKHKNSERVDSLVGPQPGEEAQWMLEAWIELLKRWIEISKELDVDVSSIDALKVAMKYDPRLQFELAPTQRNDAELLVAGKLSEARKAWLFFTVKWYAHYHDISEEKASYQISSEPWCKEVFGTNADSTLYRRYREANKSRPCLAELIEALCAQTRDDPVLYGFALVCAQNPNIDANFSDNFSGAGNLSVRERMKSVLNEIIKSIQPMENDDGKRPRQ